MKPANSLFTFFLPTLCLLTFFLLLGAPPATNSIGIGLLSISPGEFRMGADVDPIPKTLLEAPGRVMSPRPAAGDVDEAPAHTVRITRPFRISQTAITLDQYRQFRREFEANPTYAPYATGMSWYDANEFCKWLNTKEPGKNYRLPTEAEWEYAARKSNLTRTAGIAEWTLDWYGPYEPAAQTDPTGRAAGMAKVVRGAALDKGTAALPYFARPANRASMAPTFFSPADNIGFRIVEGSAPTGKPLPEQPPFFRQAIKQTSIDTTRGPDPAQPFFHSQRLFPALGPSISKLDMRTTGPQIGLSRGLGVAYHNSAIQVLSNGDLVAAYYNSPSDENDPDQTILSMRLRYGTDEWDLPDAWPAFADAAEAAPVFWNDGKKLWFFFGSPRLIGAPPFQYMQSTDNGANWSEVHFPDLDGPVGDYTPQPINSIVRAKDGTIYLPVDGKSSTSALFATKDEGDTWTDTGGRTGGRHTTVALAADGTTLIGMGGKNSNVDGKMPVSISKDGGETWEVKATEFLPLGSGQRPSLIRLRSGKLFFVSDYMVKKGPGPKRKGAFVALSADDGQTWQTRELPGITTVGYVTATESDDRIIRIVTSVNQPFDVCISLNEAWVKYGGPDIGTAVKITGVEAASEKYPSGKIRAEWTGGWSPDGRYLLEGRQTFYYENGRKQWESNFHAGLHTGTETYWSDTGRKEWDKVYSLGGQFTWRIYRRDGTVSAESLWQGKELIRIAKK